MLELCLILVLATTSLGIFLATKYSKLKKRHHILEDTHLLLEQAILDLNSEKEVLEKLARKDALTGLDNRYALAEGSEKMILSAQRHKEKICGIFVDIDNFKIFNDKFGHLAGDAALKLVAKTILGCTRSNDLVARFGGDEVAILWSSEDPSKDTLIQRLSEAFDVMSFSWPVEEELVEVKISVTMGFGCNSAEGDPAEILKTLIHKSDMVMLDSKKYKDDKS